MLNSAAGVTLPSAIAPPIRTIDSGRASGCCASRSATFVSGPVATRTAPGTSSASRSTACSSTGSVVGVRKVGPVEPGLAVHLGGDAERADERPVGALRDRDLGAAGELEHAQRVGGRLRDGLVAGDGRDRAQLELGRGEREQKRDRVVVARVAVEDDRRRHAAEPTFARAPSAARARARRARGRRGRARSRPSRRRAATHGCRAPRRRSPARRPDRGEAARCTRAGSPARGRAR